MRSTFMLRQADKPEWSLSFRRPTKAAHMRSFLALTVVATFRSRQSPPVAAEEGVELISCDFERSFSFSGFTLKAEVV
jgi:hypothetical protein